ncbi:MAG: 2TM domain-containing protein [Lewinella sp.]|nr:2TM domain-containing protein [Lewinella sp.]
MSSRNVEDDVYRKAAKRVKAKKDFYNHFATYAVMGVFFFLLNAATAWGHWWFFWPMLGWGIGIFFHYLDAFGLPGVGEVNEPGWEERAIDEELRKMGYPKQRKTAKPKMDDDYLELREMKKEKAVRKPDWDEDELV